MSRAEYHREYYRRHVDSAAWRETAAFAVNDLGQEAMAVIELCNLLACTNISTETLPVPPSLQRSRKRRGKVPFFEYKTLIIQETSPKGESQGGHHAPPRLHYRRGHIRRLGDGKKTWVRATMVGDKDRGLIVKDYDARGVRPELPT